ncbi:ABC transporter substrate-binding protein [Bacillus sp. SA1-12]|uniref:ABC transporter substrate-binding protein n=1 Tax=Bacillus sp. SA1-12 TaxID=1455638 RepID=UPI00062621B1|nr:sugar ABC transporter substrate-binding protein [Bacillus sp. SA1-12]KKI92152.1 ABC transporter substrate-binding protein [Bacillus sp. SA1-12]
MKSHRFWYKSLTVFMVVLLLLLSACSGNKKETSGSGADGTLSIMWWGPQERHDATLKALDIYTEQNPDVKFKPEYLAWDGYWSKLPTLAASKSMTDILQMDSAYMDEYVSRGTLEDLSDIDLSGIVDPKIIENLKIDGKLYGIPLSHNGQGLAFNKAELEAAGIPLPQKDWTWEDYFDFGINARSKLPEGKYPVNDYSSGWDWYQYYQTSMGKGPVLEGDKFNLDKDLWFEFQKIHEEFRKEGIVPPPDVQTAFLENDPKGDPMASGTVMTRNATVGSVSVLESLMPGKVEVVNIPTGPAGGGWAQPTIFLSISATSKKKEKAKEFVKWFISDMEAGKVLGLTRGIPLSEEIYKELEPTLEPKDVLSKKLMETAIDKALPFYPPPAGWSEWVQAYEKEMQAVMYGQQSLEEAFEKINELGTSTAAKLSGK